MVEHPARPTLLRCAIHVLVEPGVKTILTQPLGEPQNLISVLVRVVAIVNEDYLPRHEIPHPN